MFEKEGRRNYQFLPDEIICHILGYLTVPKDHLLKLYVSSVNNLYLVNKQFNKCCNNIFNKTFYKDLLFSTFLKYVTTELQQKIIGVYNYKTIYSYLNHYNDLKIKQPKFYNGKTKMKELNKLNELYKEIKITVLGEHSVGKSAITFRYIRNEFVENNDVIIDEMYRMCTKVEERIFNLDIIDTVGQEDYRAMRDHFYRADCILTVCDLTDKRSLNEVEYSIGRFYRVNDHNDDLPIIIVGNKLDLIEQENKTREITNEIIEELVGRLCKNCKLKPIYIETSAKTGYNIDTVFYEAIRLTQGGYIDWNDVVTRLLNGENLFEEFRTKSHKCILM
ncbi:hypothetical protein ABK040_006899 [Willaertia magna]